MNWIAKRMSEIQFFFDSYAMIELIKGNPNYGKYINAKIVTTKLNLFEVCYFLIRDFGEGKAREYMRKYWDSIIDFDIEIILVATKLKLTKKREELSMTDCIGYVLAKSLGVKFLTGDEKFKDMENVEHAK